MRKKLKREQPVRSSRTISEIIKKSKGVTVSERTIRRHLEVRGATTSRLTGKKRTYVRFERRSPNELWTGDAMSGPMVVISGKKKRSHLIAFVDDYSRLIPHGEFFPDEKLPRLERTFRIAIEKRGLPDDVYVDRGSIFISHQFDGICARLGIKRILASPGEPAQKGKDRAFLPYSKKPVSP